MDKSELIYKKQMQGVIAAHTVGMKSLEYRVKELEDYVHTVMRGPKGDKGEDGVDGHGFGLTEEDIKNAVREGVVEGVVEGLQELVEGLNV